MTQRVVTGLQVLTEVDSATVRRAGDGWQTELEGRRADGSPARETLPVHVRKDLALADVPPGVKTIIQN